MLHLKYFLKSMLVISMLFLFWKQDLSAQQIQVKRSHAISEPQSGILNSNVNATGTLNVVAIMVEFQPDSNRLTTGSGIFGPDGMEGLPFLRNADDFRVEPLPHNRNYFEAHLEFAKNYYQKSSDGQLTIDYKVLPSIYRLPKKMEEYSPTGETFTNEKIAELIRDAWIEVEKGPNFDATGLDPETTAFVIFHAGVGRDIELTGTSLDITPFDIPSLYLRKQNLSNLLEDPGFNGFSVNDGSFRVTNSMVIPRTETRRGLDIQENEFAFPLSINGLLIASIGSHLGLPDLFNTETGDPAIGRFGLMDGAGFFAYNGLLPPEPSAWEKIYLGWETPFEIDTDTSGDILLPAGSLDQPNSIAKYSLSSSEYFLVENRHRDPDGIGTTITIQKPDGTEVEQTFTNQDEAFVFQEADFDTLLEAGTFINATNFDFSLPGGLDVGENENDPADDRNLNGGILIWHIDEAKIQAHLQNDRVNADPSRRGVDVEEADGAQDIGPGISGAIDNSAAFGTAFDFWWSGNNYRVILQSGQATSFYENRFGPDTRPNNNSNSGAPSFFEFHDFSGNLPTATFKVRPFELEKAPTLVSQARYKSDLIHNPTDQYGTYYPLAITTVGELPNNIVVIPSSFGNLVHNSGFSTHNNGFQVLGGGRVQQPHAGLPLMLVRRFEDTNQINIVPWQYNNGTWSTSGGITIPANPGFISSENNEVLEVDFTKIGIDIDNLNIDENYRAEGVQRSKILGNEYAQSTGDEIQFSSGTGLNTYDIHDSNYRNYVGSIEFNDGSSGFFILLDGKLLLVDPRHQQPVKIIYESGHIGWPAISDLDNDGSLDFLFADYTSNELVAINQKGGFLDYFPYQFKNGNRITGTPLIADFENDDSPDLIIPTSDSLSINLELLNTQLQPYSYSPLYVGGVSNPNAFPINPLITDNKLAAISHNGDLKVWEFDNLGEIKWGYKYGNHPYNKVSGTLGSTSPITDSYSVLNSSETYNWPNPAQENTNIRFELAAPGGTVEITVITMTGRIIFEETISSPGGFPEEVQINTQNWGSGGYVALVKATVEGKTESKLIKIGVVH